MIQSKEQELKVNMKNFAYFELKVQTQTRQERAQWPEEYLQHTNPAQNSQGQERHNLVRRLLALASIDWSPAAKS
jgi:hypothetical protein